MSQVPKNVEDVELENGHQDRSYTESIRVWVDRLQTITRELSGIIPERERHFLAIGQSISDLSGRSRELVEMTGSLASKASGEALKKDVGELFHVLARMDDRGGSEDGQDIEQHCVHLFSSIAGLQDKMDAFRPVLKRLRVLSMSIRIESARLGSEGKGFVGLASDVEGLGTKTGAYVSEVDGEIRRLMHNVESVRNSMAETKAQREETIDPLLQRIASSQEALSHVQMIAERVSASVADRIKAVSRQIDEIVSSVQFHDITRQQVEHVVQVLEEVGDILLAEPDNPESAESLEDMMSWFGDVGDLQIRQLDSTRHEFGRAMQQIRGSLQSIGDSIAEQEGEIRQFPGLDSGGDDSVLGALEKSVASLIPHLEKARESFEGTLNSLDSIIDSLEGMETFLVTVEEMGDEIELIALNASIKSAHTGEQGRSLGVLAEAIRKLSFESGQLMREVSAELEKISSASEKFRERAQEASRQIQDEEALSGQLEEVLQRLAEANREVSSTYFSMKQGIQELIRRLKELDKELDVQFEVEKELSGVMDSLEAVVHEVQAVAPQRQQKQHSGRLDEILKRYTMESERLVHMAFSGLETSSPSAGAPDGSPDSALAEAEDDADENVELF